MYKRLIAAIIVVTMVAAGVAFASDSSEAVEVDGTTTTITQAINNATGDGPIEITLTGDTTEDVTIPEGKDVILDLNSHTLKSSSSHTIVVSKGATLTINATNGGTVDCPVHAKACLYNYGTVTINGGDFTRSGEVYSTKSDGGYSNGYSSWYVVLNAGNMTVNNGTFISGYQEADGSYYLGNVSSVIKNGYTNNEKPETNIPGNIIINNGTFMGAAVIVKNDLGNLEINDGTFTMDNTDHPWAGGNNIVMNYGTMAIEGGTYEAKGSGLIIDNDNSWNRYGIYNSGTATVEGIDLRMDGDYNTGLVQRASATGNFSISNSTVTIVDSDNPTNYAIRAPENTAGTKLLIGSGSYNGAVLADVEAMTVSGGSFSEDVSDYLEPGLTQVDGVIVDSSSLPSVGDDDELPPFIPTQPAEDDDTVTIVACAAAAAVAAILAVFLIYAYRKD